jgi:hypothetical protein
VTFQIPHSMGTSLPVPLEHLTTVHIGTKTNIGPQGLNFSSGFWGGEPWTGPWGAGSLERSSGG